LLIASRVDSLRRQPGSGLPEPLDQQTSNTLRILSQAIPGLPTLLSHESGRTLWSSEPQSGGRIFDF
jgi:hypothetical protein